MSGSSTDHASTLERVVFNTADVDDARSILRSYYYPVGLDPLRGPAQFRMSFNATQLGPSTVGEANWGCDVRMTADDLAAYHVSLPLAGRLYSRHRDDKVVVHPGQAALYQPVGSNDLRWNSDCTLLCVKIDQAALESRLRTALDRPIRTPVRLAHSLDLSQGVARSWGRLVRFASVELADNDGLAHQPSMAARLVDDLIMGLLFAADHPDREELSRPAARWRPRPVKRAIDAMEADPARSFTVLELAQAANVSVRALQEAFRRHTGMAPTSYLRQIRLARAHQDLLAAGPDRITVAATAQRWGFAHLGRFAAVYRSTYGVSPSVTLRCTL